MDGSAIVVARERGERKKRRCDTPRGKDGLGDRKTVIGSESEDKYSGRGL